MTGQGKNLGLALVLGAACSILSGCCDPGDAVTVSVRGIDEPLHFLCIVAEGPEKPHVLDWYFHYEGWGILHPHDAWWNSFENPKQGETVKLFVLVRWTSAQRYGVLVRRDDLSWNVRWFDSRDVPLRDVSSLCGGGRVEFDIGDPTTWTLVDEASVRDWGVNIDEWNKEGEPHFQAKRNWRLEKTGEKR